MKRTIAGTRYAHTIQVGITSNDHFLAVDVGFAGGPSWAAASAALAVTYEIASKLVLDPELSVEVMRTPNGGGLIVHGMTAGVDALEAVSQAAREILPSRPEQIERRGS
jgi:hypothetical protein